MMNANMMKGCIFSSILIFALPLAAVWAQKALEVSSTDNVIEMDYTVPEPVIKDLGNGESAVAINERGFKSLPGETGSPVLPGRTVQILLPPDKEVNEVQVLPGEKVPIEGTYKVEFARSPRPISAPAGSPGAEKETASVAIYQSDKPYPEKLNSSYTIQHMCGYPILTLNLNPVEYVPASGKLSYYKTLRVRVLCEAAPPKRTGAGTESIMPIRNLPEDKERVLGVVHNPTTMRGYEMKQK